MRWTSDQKIPVWALICWLSYILRQDISSSPGLSPSRNVVGTYKSVRKTLKMPLYKSVCVGLERLGRVVPVLSRISSGRGPTRATYIMFLENWRMYYLPCRAFIIGWFVSRQLNQTWIDCWVNPVKVPEEQPLVMNNRWKLSTPKISSFCNLKR